MTHHEKPTPCFGKHAHAQARGGAASGPGCDRPRLARIAEVAVGCSLVCLATLATVLTLARWDEEPRGPSAAIVDQLSLTLPNPGFVEAATRTLGQAGFAVDYYPGEQVTVDFFRNLPTHGYELVILRVHSGIAKATGAPSLFTSEAYASTKYVGEQRAGRFGRARYYEGGEEYFGIYPEFVRSSMSGSFDKTLVIMMGCWGLARSDMAEAFVQTGAGAVVSWDGLVSGPHTDESTEHLLSYLLANRLTVGQAVSRTAAEVGTDPTYGSRLLFYPPEAAGLGLAYTYVAP